MTALRLMNTSSDTPKDVSDVYDYVSADGTLLYQVLRKVPKKFLQRRPDGKGGWIWNLADTERVPYRLPQLLQAVQKNQSITIWIAEGEKCVNILTRLGFVATCNSEGAGKWKPNLSQYFTGLDVVIVADNDEPGQKHAQEVAKALSPIASRVRVISDLPVKEKGDVVDLTVSMGDEGAREFLLTMAADTDPIQSETAVTPLNTKPLPPIASVHINGNGSNAVLDEMPIEQINSVPGLDKLERYAFGWRLTIGDVVLNFQDVEEKKGEIRSEIYLHKGRILLDFDTNFNLGSSRIRTTFANRFEKELPKFPYDWTKTIDLACATIVQAERSLDDSKTLGVKATRTREPYYFWPLLRDGGCSLIFGDGGTGKSLVTEWIAMVLASGCAVPAPCEIRRQAKVLVLDWESDFETWNFRLQRLSAGAGIEPPDIEYLAMDKPLVDRVRAISRKMADIGADVAIHDSLSWAAGGSLLDDDVARSYLQAVRQLGGSHLAIAHVSSDTAKNGFRDAKAFGSRFWHHGPRLTTYLRRSENGTIAFLRKKANNDAPMDDAWGLDFRWDGEDGPITVYGANIIDAPDLEPMGKLTDRVYNMLDGGREMSSKDLATAVEVGQEYLNASLRRDGRFVCSEGGGRGKPSLWRRVR